MSTPKLCGHEAEYQIDKQNQRRPMKINTKPDELSSLLAPEILDKLYSGRSMQLPKYLRTSHPFNSLNDSKFMHAEEMALSTSLQQAAFKGVDVHQASLQQNP